MLRTIKALQSREARTQPPNSGLLQPHETPRGLDPRADVQSLGHPQFAAGTPTERVDSLMGIGGAEAAENDAPLVCLAISIIIFEKQQLGSLADVCAALPQFQSGGNH